MTPKIAFLSFLKVVPFLYTAYSAFYSERVSPYPFALTPKRYGGLLFTVPKKNERGPLTLTLTRTPYSYLYQKKKKPYSKKVRVDSFLPQGGFLCYPFGVRVRGLPSLQYPFYLLYHTSYS